MNPRRHPKGSGSRGGQFAAGSNAESSVSLPAQSDPPDEGLDAVDESDAATERSVESALDSSDPEQLSSAVSSPSETVRFAVSMSQNLTEPMVQKLMGPDQPVGVRVNVAANHPHYAAAMAASDPDHFVRVFALSRAANLSPGMRVRLGDDTRIWELRRFAKDPLAFGGARNGPSDGFANGPAHE